MDPRKIFVGITLMMIGMTLISISSVHTDFAGLILIGPIPIVIASNMSIGTYVLIFAAILVMLTFLFFR